MVSKCPCRRRPEVYGGMPSDPETFGRRSFPAVRDRLNGVRHRRDKTYASAGTGSTVGGSGSGANEMSTQRIRVVVGEGHAQRAGLLKFVLEGEGFDVAAVATTVPELARHLTDDRPDVVVLDDGLGTTVVSMVHRLLPAVKIVLVWPRGLLAIGGDASVEPSDVLRDLG